VPADRPSLEDILLHRWMLESCEQVDKKLCETNETENHLKSTSDVGLHTHVEHNGAVCQDELSVMHQCSNLPGCLDTITLSYNPLLSPSQHILDTTQLYAEPSSDTCVELCAKPSRDMCVELCAEPSSDKSVKFFAGLSSDTCVELCAEPSSDTCVELCAEPSSDRCIEQFGGPSCDRRVELCAEWSSNRCVELTAGPSSDRYVELTAGPSSDRCVELTAGPSSDSCVKLCVSLSSEEAVEFFSQQSSNNTVEQSVELLSDDYANRECLLSSGVSQTSELCADRTVTKSSSSVDNVGMSQHKVSSNRDGCLDGHIVLSSVDRTVSRCSVSDCNATGSNYDDGVCLLCETVDHLCRHSIKPS